MMKKSDEKVFKGLKAFVEDESYFDDYKTFVPKDHHVLVRLMVYRPEFNKAVSALKVPDGKGGWTSPEQVYDIQILPIVKIIKVPEGITNIKPGDLYTVPRSDVIGAEDNPKFLHWKSTFGESAENKTLNVKPPVDMPQKIANIDLNWERYMFVRPWILKPEIQDMETYLLPTLKLQMKYNYDLGK